MAAKVKKGRPARISARSLHPSLVEEVSRGAVQTGKTPEPVPQNKHAKRTATKRRLKGEATMQNRGVETDT
jgi:hypothetical protein